MPPVKDAESSAGTKTMDLDDAAHKIYMPTADFEEAKTGARPTAKAGTFKIVVVARR